MKSNAKPLRAEIKHAAILQAAKKIFLSQGYSLASMDGIALEANVSKRTIYDHFNTKKGLFEAMLNMHWITLMESPQQLFSSKHNISKQLQHFANIFLEFLYQPDTIALFRLLIAEADQFPELMTHLVIDEKAPFTRALINFLQDKKKSRELCIDHPDRSAAYFMGMLKEYHFWPMMLGFSQQKHLPRKNHLIDEVVSVFLKAYQPKQQ
jgi:AcrR family transcriptional regulator